MGPFVKVYRLLLVFLFSPVYDLLIRYINAIERKVRSDKERSVFSRRHDETFSARVRDLWQIHRPTSRGKTLTSFVRNSKALGKVSFVKFARSLGLRSLGSLPTTKLNLPIITYQRAM